MQPTKLNCHLVKIRKKRKEKKCHFYRLGRRVDRMEKSIGSIVTKIDAVLAKLETMERGRNKRKATMSKILGTITESDGRKYYEELDLFSIEFCFLAVNEFSLGF